MSEAVAAPPIARFTIIGNKSLVSAATMLAAVMQVIDTTIANVALPHMQGGLGATQDQITWVLTSYITASAIAMPLAGWLSGRFGRKRVFVVSVIGFTIASGFCGAAQTLAQIVFFRILQGVFGAALVPLSQAVMLDTFPVEKRGPAMALWGIGIMVGPILGPTLGGYLTDNFSWRWVFYINLPVGALAWLGIAVSIPETARDLCRRFDFFGFAMLGLGVGALQILLDRGELKDWFQSGEIRVEATLAAVGFYCFIVHSATTEDSFIHRRIFRDRNLVTGVVIVFVVGIIHLASSALLPPLLQGLLNYPVMTTGIVMAPRGIGTMISMFVAGRLVQRLDPRWLIFAGLALTAYSLFEITVLFSTQVDSWTVIWTGLVQGLGLGLVFTPLSVLTFASLPAALRTEAAGLFNLARNSGSSIGISVVMAVFATNLQVVHASMASHVGPFNPFLRAPYVPQLFFFMPQKTSIAMLNAEITRQAAMIAFIDGFKLMMIITVAAIPLIVLLRNQRRLPTAAQTAAIPAGRTSKQSP